MALLTSNVILPSHLSLKQISKKLLPTKQNWGNLLNLVRPTPFIYNSDCTNYFTIVRESMEAYGQEKTIMSPINSIDGREFGRIESAIPVDPKAVREVINTYPRGGTWMLDSS